MGLRRHPPLNLIWDWSRTIKDMIASDDGLGASVIAACHRCKPAIHLDLHKIAEVRGPFWTLWERYPRCPQCGDRMVILAGHREGAQRIVLKTSEGMAHPTVSELHESCPWCGIHPRTGKPARRTLE